MELATGLLILATCAQTALAIALLMKVQVFLKLNVRLGRMIEEIQTTRDEMVEGIVGAIQEKLLTDEVPAKGTRAH